MLSTLERRKRQSWWSLQEFTTCSKCSIQQLNNCEQALGRVMIGCPIYGPGSNALGSEGPSMLVG